MGLDPSRRAAVELARATAVLRTAFDLEPDRAEVATFPFGVTARVGDRAWVVSMSDDLAALGGVLVWMDRHRCSAVDLVVDHHPGVHARRAALLAPEMTVWRTEGSQVLAATPDPLPPPLDPPDDTAHLEEVLTDAGLEIVCEDGIIRGELAGLEVARILHGPDGPVLEAGVGRFDREAGALLHAGRSPAEAVAAVVAQIGPHRRRGADPHAVNRLARERWLRSEVWRDPSLVGVARPHAVEPIPPRSSLREPGPAALLALDGARRVLVACSVGFDLGLVPEIADLVARHSPDEVRVVVPERDALPARSASLGGLGLAVRLVGISAPWSW